MGTTGSVVLRVLSRQSFRGGLSRVPARSGLKVPGRLGLLGGASRCKSLPLSQRAHSLHRALQFDHRQTFREKKTLPGTRAHVSGAQRVANFC
jgi:hypothetical protein